MSPHSKLVTSILALSALGLALLSSVLFDSYQQSSMTSQIRSLEAHSQSLRNYLSRYAADADESLESLLPAAHAFASPEHIIFLVDENGQLHPADGNQDWDNKQVSAPLQASIRARNSGFG